MDKQKQIDKDINVRSKMIGEMAKLLDGYWSTKSKCPFDKKCPYLGGSVRFTCNDCLRAYTIYNAGYRKIPENAVVLTSNQKISLEHEWYCLGYEQARKETAEKFSERLKEIAKRKLELYGVQIVDLDDIDEICKEITEGKA